jgi:DNA-binding transcriptional ArsR family regulator
VKQSSDNAASARLSDTFAALSDPIRRGMLARLARGPCSVSQLGAPFRVSAPAISRHLRVLEASGLIARWKSGRVHYCQIIADPLWRAGDWIDRQRRFWEQQFDALDDFLQREDGTWTQQRPKEPAPSKRPPPSSVSDAESQRHRSGSSRRGRARKR